MKLIYQTISNFSLPKKTTRNMSDSEFVKNVVIVGDGAVGKTCVLHSFTEQKFLESYSPTIYDKGEITIKVDGQDYTIQLHDTAGQEELDRIRKIIYKTADAFILCYSVENFDSYENVQTKWVPELRSVQPGIPIILIGTKVDLREDDNKKFVQTSDGEKLKRSIRARSFLECSSKTFKNINEVIYEAVRATLEPEPIETAAEEVEPSCFSCFSCC